MVLVIDQVKERNTLVECQSMDGIEGDCISKVTKVIQKTIIDVNEDGVEAAAVTAVMVDRNAPLPSVPVLFLADHPFQFFVYESQEDLVLFEGLVGDPGATYDLEEPALPAQHTDSTFWVDTFNVDPRSPTDDSSAPLQSFLLISLVSIGIAAFLFR